MKEISIKFVDFWRSLDCLDNKFVKALSAKYKVRVLAPDSREVPDILFYSCFGHAHFKYADCVKVYFTGENDVPDFNECDYALSFQPLEFGRRHMRYPLYMLYEIADALSPEPIADEAALCRGFCTALLRNVHSCAPERLKVIDAVNRYKPVAFGGPYMNNVGGCVPTNGKIDFISRYKFNLALENSAMPGYVTEKIVEPLAANTVPIYWGAPDVALDFNPEAFINVADYDTIDSFIADLKDIDNDAARYLSMLRAPRLNAGSSLDFDTRLSEFLCNIASEMKVMRPRYAQGEAYYRRNRALKSVFGRPAIVNAIIKIIK